MPDRSIVHVGALPGERSGGAVGGVGAYTASLLDILAAGRFAHALVANEDAGRSEIEALEPRVHVDPTWRFGDVGALRAIERALDRRRSDIMHVQHELFLYGPSAYALLFPIFLRRRRPRHRVVVTVHGVTTAREIDESLLAGRRSPLPLSVVRPVIIGIFRAIARSGVELVVHSETLRARLLELGAEPGRVTVIPHPLFTARAAAAAPIDRARARTQLGISDDAQVVLTWGYWNGYKGLEVLTAGFERFAQAHPRAQLLLGTGPHPQHRSDPAYMQAYGAASTALNGPGRRHVGFIDDALLPVYIAAADVCVFAYTRHLAASGPATFALTVGKPVLFSNVFPDVPTPLTFAPEPVDLAAALTRFFDAPERHAAASLVLRDRATDERIRDAYDGLYERMLATTPS